MIEVFLKIKNASAEGLLNTEDSTILVKARVVFENLFSEGLKNYNYMSLGMKLVNSDKLRDYVLREVINLTA